MTMLKKKLYILQQNQNFQSHQIQDEFVLINPTRVELRDHGKLLHTLDWLLSDNNTNMEIRGSLIWRD